jgi:toxin YoeB
MRRIVFLPKAFEAYTYWASEDKQIYRKIFSLIQDIQRTPFSGLGKPEPLRHDLQGFWSRRINDEHRLVYKVIDEDILIVSCKYHYE